MSQTPILILSDCPSQSSGLARITRDVATVLSSSDKLRVATLGLQGTGSSKLPFQTYHLHPAEFGELTLPGVWEEWSQGEPGVVLTIWDLARILWLARPEFVQDEGLRGWLEFARRSKFKLWSYVPVDATGPGDRLTVMARDTLLGIDRILAFTPWARDVIARTIGAEEAGRRGLSWCPHGLNTRIFTPRQVYTLQKSSDASEAAVGDGGEMVQGLVARPSRVSKVVWHGVPADKRTVLLGVSAGEGGSHEEATRQEREAVRAVGADVEPVAYDGRATLSQARGRDVSQGQAAQGVQAEGVGRVDQAGRGRPEAGRAAHRRPARGDQAHEEGGVPLVGCIATNQIRKDWGTAVAACAALLERRKGNLRLWFHVDQVERAHAWNLNALIADYELGEYVELTTPPQEDAWLASQYRRCALTILPSSEGWGFPLAESLGCGVPCLHGDYAGGASWMREFGLADLLVPVHTWRLEGVHDSLRPVFRPEDWVAAMERVLKARPDSAWLASRVEHLSYKKLGVQWKRWVEEGL